MATGRNTRSERGAVSTMFAVLGGAVFFALGLVVDGGRQLGALTEARDLADNAARAGAQGVDIDQWRATGVPVIDPGLAQTEIDELMALARPTNNARVTNVVIDGSAITVTIQMDAPRSFFLTNRQVTVSETADAQSGVAAP